jgi:hypothetical protein
MGIEILRSDLNTLCLFVVCWNMAIVSRSLIEPTRSARFSQRPGIAIVTWTQYATSPSYCGNTYCFHSQTMLFQLMLPMVLVSWSRVVPSQTFGDFRRSHCESSIHKKRFSSENLITIHIINLKLTQLAMITAGRRLTVQRLPYQTLRIAGTAIIHWLLGDSAWKSSHGIKEGWARKRGGWAWKKGDGTDVPTASLSN